MRTSNNIKHCPYQWYRDNNFRLPHSCPIAAHIFDIFSVQAECWMEWNNKFGKWTKSKVCHFVPCIIILWWEMYSIIWICDKLQQKVCLFLKMLTFFASSKKRASNKLSIDTNLLKIELQLLKIWEGKVPLLWCVTYGLFISLFLPYTIPILLIDGSSRWSSQVNDVHISSLIMYTLLPFKVKDQTRSWFAFSFTSAYNSTVLPLFKAKAFWKTFLIIFFCGYI